MRLGFDIIPYQAIFKKPAKTSRNTFEHRDIHFIRLWEEGKESKVGWGEAAPLHLLSKDDLPNYDAILRQKLSEFTLEGHIDDSMAFLYPSITFGIETALNDLQNGSNQVIFQNSPKQFPLAINGLVWMDDEESMIQQAFKLVAEGFDCIKFKVGALDFDAECRILETFRKKHDARNILLRLDANGAFHPIEAKEQLRELRKFGIQSIEQPIRQGQREEMARLVAQRIIPIALDEELIDVQQKSDLRTLLKDIKPEFIVLKPSLHGGYAQCLCWIQEANLLNVGFWITSALETNIGLNGIAQFASIYAQGGYQGLGTGTLYKNNIPGPLFVKDGFLQMDPETPWDFSGILNPDHLN
jgi:o-succinylbenzoate synthase